MLERDEGGGIGSRVRAALSYECVRWGLFERGRDTDRRTLRETACGSLSTSGLLVDGARWCAMVFRLSCQKPLIS
jgi:hypothetical protein